MAPVVGGNSKCLGSRFWFGLTIKGYNLLSAESPPVVSMCAQNFGSVTVLLGRTQGQLGDTTTRRLTPTIVGAFSHLVDFNLGLYHTCVVNRTTEGEFGDGSVGWGLYGQLGDGES